MPFLTLEHITENINIEEGMIVADFGAGSGYHAIPIAKIVGDTGQVYALDVQKEALEVIRRKARENNLYNIKAIWADLETPGGSQLADELVDHVLISNILFQAEDKTAIAKEAFRILKPRGTASIIEWDKTASTTVPPRTHLIDKEEVKRIFTSVGFITEKEFYAGEHHYGIYLRKAES